METIASNRNTGLWRNIVNIKIENIGVQLYPCGFTNYFTQLPLYHTHRYHELFFVKMGITQVTTLKGVQRFTAGDCFIVPAGVPHYRRDISPDSLDLAYDLRFAMFRVPDAPESAADIYGPLQKILENADDVVKIPGGTALRHSVMAINAEHLEVLPFSELRLKAHLTALIIDMYRLLIDEEPLHNAAAEPPEKPDRLDDLCVRIDFLINRRFAHPPLTIESVAEQLHLSVRQTERLIMKMYGKTFKRKLMEVRLKNARMVLRYTNAPIADVAKFCGYSSHSGLIKAFTDEFGISPAEYRESAKTK